MNLGYSHQVIVSEIPGITIEAPGPEQDHHFRRRQAAGRPVRRGSPREAPPEPYKGKGIKYADEVIRRKEGKTGGKGKK